MLATIRKALIAAGVGAAGALGQAMLDGDLTRPEVLVAAGVGLAAGVATWAIPNRPDTGWDIAEEGK